MTRLVYILLVSLALVSPVHAGGFFQGDLNSIATPLDLQYSSVLFDRFSVNSSGDLLVGATEKAPGAATAALAGLGAGNVNSGTHSYKITHVTAAGETDASAVSGTVTTTAGDGQVALSAIPTGSSFVTSRKVYRTAAGNAVTGPWLLLATIAGNAPTTYADNIADASLTTTAPTTNTAVDTRMSLLNNGNVGIGDLTPAAMLTVGSSAVTTTGPELITNGTFTGGTTGWTLDSNVVYGTNNVISTYTGGNPYLSTTFETVAGNTYRLTFTVSAANAPVYLYFNSNTLEFNNEDPSTNGTVTVVFQTNFTGTETIWFDDWSYVTGNTWTLDDVSIKQTTLPISALKVVGYDGATWLSLGGDLLGNTAVGEAALTANTTGQRNSVLGQEALYFNTTGRDNSAFGRRALHTNTAGTGNNAFGVGALYFNTTGVDSSAFGYRALYSNTTGGSNSALGSEALYLNTTGTNNSATGLVALRTNTTGINNSAFGSQALYANTTGSSNSAVGYRSLLASITGSRNVALGAFSGSYELGSDSFYVDNQDRVNTAGDKAGALLYGTFNATPASQTLKINAATTIAGATSVPLLDLRAGDLTMSGANGQKWVQGYKTELTTIAAAATTTTTITIPANAILEAVLMRVTTVIPTAATMVVTATTTGTILQQGASISVAADTTDIGTRANGTNYGGVAAQTITITPNATPANDTGRVRFDIYYRFPTVATS